MEENADRIWPLPEMSGKFGGTMYTAKSRPFSESRKNPWTVVCLLFSTRNFTEVEVVLLKYPKEFPALEDKYFQYLNPSLYWKIEIIQYPKNPCDEGTLNFVSQEFHWSVSWFKVIPCSFPESLYFIENFPEYFTELQFYDCMIHWLHRNWSRKIGLYSVYQNLIFHEKKTWNYSMKVVIISNIDNYIFKTDHLWHIFLKVSLNLKFPALFKENSLLFSVSRSIHWTDRLP